MERTKHLPSFVNCVGLQETFDHPELIYFGLTALVALLRELQKHVLKKHLVVVAKADITIRNKLCIEKKLKYICINHRKRG